MKTNPKSINFSKYLLTETPIAGSLEPAPLKENPVSFCVQTVDGNKPRGVNFIDTARSKPKDDE